MSRFALTLVSARVFSQFSRSKQSLFNDKSMHAYRVVLEYSGPGSGDSPFKRKTLVISAFDPDTPSDALVEITTLRSPRREGLIPRFRLGDVPKEDDARYIKEYLCISLMFDQMMSGFALNGRKRKKLDQE
ncbi:hypothetical protein PAPYR_13461 [Paratrimastix pyriformis]|uniref:Uncharacterized protein n=1 Tax=Paratrimastix pyriformis TaxID=342808 RepID=A0ABQ8U3P3_9EUKA|nr:hypothetical protein PAPYR_13461 [Paratrimastix pyriformis]